MKNVARTTIFTTHTPVPAGSDEFPLWLIDKYFSYRWPELGLDHEQFIDLARHQMPWGETFGMPLLAFKFVGPPQWGLRTARAGGTQDVEFLVARPERG